MSKEINPAVVIIYTILAFLVITGLYIFQTKLIEEFPIFGYSKEELMGRALYCNNVLCPERGYEYGTFGMIEKQEVCFCGNASEGGWVQEAYFNYQ